MRRSLLLGAGCLLLAACARPSTLPPDEVLRRSATASQTLHSSTFQGEGTLALAAEGASQSYAFTLTGTLQNAGRQTDLTLNVDGRIGAADQAYQLSGRLQVMSLSRSEVYLRLDDVQSEPAYPLLSQDLLRDFQGQWWLLTDSGAVADPADVTPDVSLLHLQSQVVRVTEDRGIERRDGREAYVYDVAVDQAQLAAFLERLAPGTAGESGWLRDFDATGTLEIDAETFYVRRVNWQLLSKTGSAQSFRLEFSLAFQNQNAAPPIRAPKDAKLFQPRSGTGAPPLAPIPRP